MRKWQLKPPRLRKKMGRELGRYAPFIVLDDTGLDMEFERALIAK
jgi:hypothetical protein